MNKNKNTDTNSNNNEPPENIVKEGQSLIDEKKFAEALSFINNHLTDYPKSITFNNFLGLLALSDNNFDDAKVYFDKAFEYGSDIKVYNNNLSIIYSTIGSNFFDNEDYKSALNNFLLAIKQGPLNPLINYINVHKCYRKLDDFEAAEMVLFDAVNIVPNSFIIYYHLFEMEMERGQYDKALNYANKSYELSSNFGDSFNKLPLLIKYSKLLRAFGLITESIKVYLKAYLIDPGSKLIATDITFLYLDINDFKSAYKYIQLAHDIDPDNRLINSLKYFIEYKLNNIDTITELSAIATNNPNYNLPYQYIAEIYFDKQEYMNSFLHYKKLGNSFYYHAIRTLLHLDDQDTLINYYDESLGFNHRNASINSIAATLLDIDINNSFLNEPLSFIYNSKSSVLFKDSLIDDVKEEIVNFFDDNDYVKDSNIDGLLNCSQTLGNFFLLGSNNIIDLKEIISKEIDKYFNSSQKPKCIFFNDWTDKYKVIGKFLKLDTESQISGVHHDEGWVTGIINLSSGDPIDISLSENILDNNIVNLPEKTISIDKGQMIFFPSSLCYKKKKSSHQDNNLIIFYVIPETVKSNFND